MAELDIELQDWITLSAHCQTVFEHLQYCFEQACPCCSNTCCLTVFLNKFCLRLSSCLPVKHYGSPRIHEQKIEYLIELAALLENRKVICP